MYSFEIRYLVKNNCLSASFVDVSLEEKLDRD